MAAQVHQLPTAETVLPAPAPEMQQPSLEQLLQHSRRLLAEGVDQARGIGELAFMEFELAVESLKWLLLAGLLFALMGLLCCTFLIAALAVLLIDTVTPAAVLLLCGVINAIGVCVMFFWLKSLTRKMTFRNLRQQFSGADAGSHVKN